MDDGWLESRLAGNGTADRGGFTEAYLTEEGFTQEARKREVGIAWLGQPLTVDLTWKLETTDFATACRGSGPRPQACCAAAPAVHEVHL